MCPVGSIRLRGRFWTYEYLLYDCGLAGSGTTESTLMKRPNVGEYQRAAMYIRPMSSGALPRLLCMCPVKPRSVRACAELAKVLAIGSVRQPPKGVAGCAAAADTQHNDHQRKKGRGADTGPS